MFDAAGGAGAGDELELDSEVTGAVAHGGRGQRAFVAGGEGSCGGCPSTILRLRLRMVPLPAGRGGDRSRLSPCQGDRSLRSRVRGGRCLTLIALARDAEADQRAADGQLMAGFAVQGDDGSGDRRRQFDRGLVGHDLSEELVLGDRVADLDVPADKLGLGSAFADVGEFEDEISAGCGRGGDGRRLHLRRFGFRRRRGFGLRGHRSGLGGRVPGPLNLELHQR